MSFPDVDAPRPLTQAELNLTVAIQMIGRDIISRVPMETIDTPAFRVSSPFLNVLQDVLGLRPPEPTVLVSRDAFARGVARFEAQIFDLYNYSGSIGSNIGLGFAFSGSPSGFVSGVGNAPTGQAPTFGGGYNPFGIDSMTGKPKFSDEPSPRIPTLPPPVPPPFEPIEVQFDENEPDDPGPGPAPGPVGEGEV